MDTMTSLEDHIKQHTDRNLEAAHAADRYALWKRKCPAYSDALFIHHGIMRSIAAVDSGRHFLQNLDELYNDICPHSTYYKALHSKRRMEMIKAVEAQSYYSNSCAMSELSIDYLSEFSELDGYTITISDGHFVKHAYHTKRNNKGKVYAAGFIYSMNLRNGLLKPLCVVTNGTIRNQELPVYRDHIERQNKNNGKHIEIYDKAITDYSFWENQKKNENYMITLQKENAVSTLKEVLIFDSEDEINTGIESYELHQNGRSTFTVVRYRDPETGILRVFISTLPTSINPGLIAQLYFKRWTIEKSYDNSKNDMKEQKAWSGDNVSLNCQMRFMTMAYNFMRVFEESSKAQNPNLIHPSEKKYNKELERRQEKAKEKGGFVNPLSFKRRIARITSSTIRSVQNALLSKKSYLDFVKALVSKLLPRPNLIREH